MFSIKKVKPKISEYNVSKVTYELTMSNNDVIDVEISGKSSIECFLGDVWVSHKTAKELIEDRINYYGVINGINYKHVVTYKQLNVVEIKIDKYLILGDDIYKLDEIDDLKE